MVFSVAALVRVAVAASLWNLPLVRTPKLDSAEYLAWARRLASGDWAWPVVAPHGPGYPIVLSGLLAAGSGSLPFVMICQGLLGALTAALVALVARRVAGPRAGLFAGLALAVYGPSVYLDTALLGEGLLLFLLVCGLYALSREPMTLETVAIAGVAFGGAAAVRPTALVIAGACVVWLAALRRRAFAAIVLTLAGVATLAPVVAKNWSASRTLSIQGYGGLNTYIGNSPRHDGRATFRLGAGWDRLNAEAPLAGIADPVAQDRYYLGKTGREIRASPGRFLALLGAKTLWLVQADESRDSHSYYFFTAQSALLRWLPRWAVLFPLACVGGFVFIRAPLLLTYVAGAAVSVIVLVVGFRYRMPLVPALAVAAGAGLDLMVSAVQARKTRALATAVVTAGVAVVVSHLLSDPRNVNLAEEWALNGSALITERNLPEAEAAYRRALALDPQSGLAWDGLGLTLYNGGRLTESRSALDRALAIDRDNARAIYHLALLDDREGRTSQAAEGFERARALIPFDPEVTRDLANARRRLATELGMSGRTREARAAMQRVVALTPENADAWLDVCFLSLDLHDRPTAESAFQQAKRLGADSGRLQFAARALAAASK